ncbi:hypothetical protein ANN_22950 [Periplaneta americana]|uniref:Per a allergen n=1 Tax=Periplaneta americana TaxID=6978 RepID=A0ABQ8SKU9_PERAM|nr:hypothetical protein ANN_22950 [Periplaneta americana]
MDVREVGYDDRDWINLAQDRDQWRAYSRPTSGQGDLDLRNEQAKVWGLPNQSSGPEMSASGVHAHCGKNVLVCHNATSVVFADKAYTLARSAIR